MIHLTVLVFDLSHVAMRTQCGTGRTFCEYSSTDDYQCSRQLSLLDNLWGPDPSPSMRSLKLHLLVHQLSLNSHVHIVLRVVIGMRARPFLKSPILSRVGNIRPTMSQTDTVDADTLKPDHVLTPTLQGKKATAGDITP